MSMNSINTNMSAMVALQALNRTSDELSTVQKRISTGLRVADARDDGAAFAVAERIRGDMAATTSANQQLGGVKGLLAVTSAARSPIAPELPTMAEFLPGFEITSWGGVMAPAGLPAALVARIAQLSQTALADEILAARFRENGATPWPLGPEELAAFRAANERAFAPVIRASGAVVE